MEVTILYYAGSRRERILPAINELVPDLQVKHFSSLSDFLEHVSQPLVSSQNIALLYIDGSADLDQLIQKRALLQDMDFILILPEADEDMSNMASFLSPRLTFFEEPDPETICNVLKKFHQSRLQKKAAWARRLP